MTFFKSFKISNGVLAIMLIASLVAPGCAGRIANPILPIRATDTKLSCKGINGEQFRIQSDIQARQTEKAGVTSYNITMGILGFFLLIPWFALDLKTSQAADAEIASLQQRLGRLQQLVITRDCPLA